MEKTIYTTEYEREKFAEEWNAICKKLKASGYDLSKIKITVKESKS